MSIFKQGCRKMGTIHITMMKNWVSHKLFLRKRGLIVYLAALKKGVIRIAQMLVNLALGQVGLS